MEEEQPKESEDSEQSSWQFHGGDDSSVPETNSASPAFDHEREAAIDPVHWTASEYITHQKSAGWYAVFGLCTVVAVTLVYLLTRDKISSAMVIIVAVIFLVLGARKPRVLSYVVDEQGVGIGTKFYSYDLFKSFSVVKEAGTESIVLTSLRRFMPPITIYFAPEDAQKIIDTLSNYLPHEDRDLDMIDNFMHKIRF